ncbi:ABC transporter substrate-binding protein [Amycolatopsis sp. H20-H5]|uniref:ABC transporter substrate-binding protein n=1 Tax=Amycolatopsis sp. H20-H5 TaxID=3046309 RepID=UPI002DB77B9A|nr:ABC transporter substrate-binding protein [Amycolatopsis sp. H20-H5]MEC3982646.1 ABC transporter substrate-binding protein [Amycolatopsis sp. H20-H5]
MKTFARFLAVALLAGSLVSGCSATGGSGKVSVLASWTGDEETAFRAVLTAFTEESGIVVDYQGTRALDQVLASDVQRGTAPDVAVLPNPGSLATYVRSGDLYPLDLGAEADSYGQQWLNLQKVGTDRQYAVAVKADLKSAIWYNTARLRGPKPTTWAELVALGTSLDTPWCLGMGAPPTSGWPGTDWIEDILLHSAGTEVYRRFSAGTLPWTSPQVRTAWTDWGTLVTGPKSVRGGAAAALLTDFGDSAKPMFANPPGCALEHQASFMMSRYQAIQRPDGSSPRAGADFDFFRFPGRSVSEVSADLAGMFHDTPQARALTKFLASPKAQAIWPANRSGSAFSANRAVDTGIYGDPVSKRVATSLVSDAQLCFDASDLMPATMTGAFYRAVLEFLSAPSKLDTLLEQLEKIRQGIPAAGWLNIPCG